MADKISFKDILSRIGAQVFVVPGFAIVFAIGFIVLFAHWFAETRATHTRVVPISYPAPPEVPVPKAKPEAKPAAVKPKPKPKPKPHRHAASKPRAERTERVLQVSCSQVRWAHKNLTSDEIRQYEHNDIIRRGLTRAQIVQQRSEVRECLDGE